ncbi:hypothetical protein DTO96_100761 [Ephemeroptericola cinctiostellae]|uniref:Lipoprotein n=1 Tax=Ephemeroptericola cinctiostellae TaxID=2268024 RepID=A0A345D9K6_9BURK|nr:hypothetical protein [Ephemeroptericola cinctiostellae]AXF85044.1 hypothetical protein DTO96_100761 [Ephemeroptericola cinctiostellae]
MKKIISVAVAAALGFASVSAMACPKGSTLTGGVGKHHKGGKCSPKGAASASTAVTAPASTVKK